jgi:hypothetical protein
MCTKPLGPPTSKERWGIESNHHNYQRASVAGFPYQSDTVQALASLHNARERHSSHYGIFPSLVKWPAMDMLRHDHHERTEKCLAHKETCGMSVAT